MAHDPSNYAPFDTVRLARQMAREVGCEEPIEVLCVESDDLQFQQMTQTLHQIGDYNVTRVRDAEEARTSLDSRNVDFCLFTSDNYQPEMVAVCRKSKTPMLVFHTVTPVVTDAMKEVATIQYFNGRLNRVPVSWNSMRVAIRQTLHQCHVMAH